MESLGADHFEAAVRRLGLAGRAICLHSSLRSFGSPVRPASLVDGLLAAGCTALVPTFSWDAYAVAPPPDMRPPKNGTDYEGPFRAAHERYFSTESDQIDEAMGAVPRYVVSQPERERGRHPLVSFSAAGKQATELLSSQAYLDPFAPLRALVAMGGSVLLAGVGYTSMTLLHLAEHDAGRAPFLRWAAHNDGRPTYAAVGGCSAGFEAFEPWLEAQETFVGRSRWRALDATQTLARATAEILADPSLTRCGDPTCLRCRDVDKDRCSDVSVMPLTE